MNDQNEANQDQDDFSPVLEALFAYNNDIESLEQFIALVESVLGSNWREDIYERLNVYDPDTIKVAREKLEDIINFESARITWEEASKIIENPEAQDLDAVANRLDDFKYWLSFFGDEGSKLFDSLNNICNNFYNEMLAPNFDVVPIEDYGADNNELALSEQNLETPPPVYRDRSESHYSINVYEHLPPPDADYSYLENGIADDVLWYMNNYILLMDYYERTIARIGARCIRMGGITLEQYPHFRYILDLLEEICEVGDIILQHRELEPLIEARIQGGVIKFKRDLSDYKSELEKNETPDMIKEEEDMSEIMEKLGALAPEEDNAGMGIDELINKLSSETGISSTANYDTEDDLPPPPPPPEEKKIKRYFGKRPPTKQPPVKQPMNKQPIAGAKQPMVKKIMVKQPMARPAQGNPPPKVKPNNPS
ncbi:MAG: hypothetical protein AB7U85_00060 [Alphaproteobacteria bacterium]